MMNKIILSNGKCNELKRQAGVIIRRLNDIKGELFPESSLHLILSDIDDQLNEALRTDLYKFRSVTKEHMLDSLMISRKGRLCSRVLFALEEINNPTPLDKIMRALMTPNILDEVVTRAWETACKDANKFVSNIEFLFAAHKSMFLCGQTF